MNIDQHLDTGPMALGALPDDEAAAFAEHLDSCPTCSAELTSFLETAAILGSSVAQTPPASLRRSVMQAVANTPQLPPLTGPVGLTDPAWGRHRQPDLESPATPSEVETVRSATVRSATVTELRRPWYRRPQSLLAAAAAAVVIAGGTTAVVASRTPSTPSASACVSAATDKSVLTPTVGSGGSITLAPNCDAAVVDMPALPAAPAGKVYQLWVIKGAGASSVSVLNSAAAATPQPITAPVHAGDTAIGVTVEPAPGSPAPTSKPFWVVKLTA